MEKRNRMFFAAVLAVAFVAGAAKSSCAGQGLSGSLKRQSLCFDGESVGCAASPTNALCL